HRRLLEQCLAHRPQIAVMKDPAAARELEAGLRGAGSATLVAHGDDALVDVARGDGVDTVMAAIVGAAGLPSTIAAAAAGKRVLLANKESLVVAGPLLLEAARAGRATLIPIDSEHNAIFQCLPAEAVRGSIAGIRRIV